jgi:hypothetical protein
MWLALTAVATNEATMKATNSHFLIFTSSFVIASLTVGAASACIRIYIIILVIAVAVMAAPIVTSVATDTTETGSIVTN